MEKTALRYSMHGGAHRIENETVTPARSTATYHCRNYVVANGIHLPTKRRAHTRGLDRRPVKEMLMVSIDLSEVQFE